MTSRRHNGTPKDRPGQRPCPVCGAGYKGYCKAHDPNRADRERDHAARVASYRAKAARR